MLVLLCASVRCDAVEQLLQDDVARSRCDVLGLDRVKRAG